MEQVQAERAAGLLWRAWQARGAFDALPADCRPADMADGYQVQHALAALADSPAYGWKIAATNVEGQRHIGVDAPVLGRLFAAFRDGDGATLSLAGNRMRVAEPEFAFRMARDLPPRPDGYDRAAVMAAVDELLLAIEVPDSRFLAFAKAGGAGLAADCACADRLVLGPPAVGWRAVDLAGHAVTALLNGTVFSRGSGADVLGHPLSALAWLAEALSRQGIGLRAGDVVTTGAAAKPVPVAPGDRVVMDFGSFGRVSVAFSD